MDHAELTTKQVLKRDIPWQTYMSTKLITNTCLLLLRRYGTQHASQRAASLEDDGPVYVRAFMNILQNISKEEIVEYVLALIDDMLTVNPKRARRLLHIKSFQDEDAYETFLRLLWKGNWFIQEKTCKILTEIVSVRPKARNGVLENGERTILNTSTNASAVSVACYDLSQLIQYHPVGRMVPADLKAKEQLMKLMVHENTEVRKNALVYFQRHFLRARYA